MFPGEEGHFAIRACIPIKNGAMPWGTTPFILLCVLFNYIMPPIPPPAGICGAGSLMFATTDSVVNKVLATEFAF